jgi:TolB-like protein/DNA-binding winged helix-turn-helix (wHTH) protein/lipoprotein NlpI
VGALRFGEDLELDLSAYELRRAGRAIRLERIPLQLLILLIERRPDLVTREQIAGKIWGQGVFLDTDGSINGAIRKIRQVLRDDADHPRYIRTITGMGYRFIAPVTLVGKAPPGVDDQMAPGGDTDPGPPLPPPDALARAEAPPSVAPADLREDTDRPVAMAPVSRSRALKRWAGAAVAVVLVGIAGVSLRASHPAASPGPSGQRLMLAVLPFVNLTGDAGQDYFTDGFTEEMITRLGSFAPQKLGVIARTSVMLYKQAQTPLDKIGHELGVQYVLEGSVRRDADRVRITAQLIQVKDQSHMWAREYDRGQPDVLQVQDEIARAIADQIELSLGQNQSSAPRPHPLSPRDYEAYDDYLKGRYFWNQRHLAALQRAMESFQKSIDLNSNDAQPYAGLADTYALMGTYRYAPPAEVFPKAREAALKALQIDPTLAAAQTSLALINEQYDWDWQTAGDRFRAAIELDPNYATAHHWYAEYLAYMGRFDEALTEIGRARRLDPRSLIMETDEAVIRYFARDYEHAIELFRSVLATEPNFPRANLIVSAYAQTGRFEEALADLREWQRLDPGPWPAAWTAYVHGRRDDTREALEAVRQVEGFRTDIEYDLLAPSIIAYVGAGLKEKAVASLQEACKEHSSLMVALKVDPLFDPLREDPRYEDLLRCVHLMP